MPPQGVLSGCRRPKTSGRPLLGAKNADRLSGRCHLRWGGGLGIVQTFDLERIAWAATGNKQEDRRNRRKQYCRLHSISLSIYGLVQ